MHAYRTPEAVDHPATGPRSGWLGRAIVSGFTASILMFFAFMAAFGFARLMAAAPFRDVRGVDTLRLWLFNLTHNPLLDAAATSLYTATAFYLAGGLVWAAIYAWLFEPRLGGPGWARGALFSLVPGVLSVVVFLPLVGGGALGYGIGAGPLPLIGNLILHLVYGIALGQLYGPFGDIDATTLQGEVTGPDAAAMAGSERMAAGGLLVGLIGGAIAGVLGALMASARPDERLLGEPAAALVLSTALLGATAGGLVGSFLGMSGGSD
jgi:hypothetical protein